MSEETELESAIAWYRDGDARAGEYKVLADAYIAHLDEQEALKVPYDWEWLSARPEFERIGGELIAYLRGADIIVSGVNPWMPVWDIVTFQRTPRTVQA